MPDPRPQTPFRLWAEDLDARERAYLLAREAPQRMDPEVRFGLSSDDAAFLGKLDRAFVDPPWMRKKS
jgi:hypothetical protein